MKKLNENVIEILMKIICNEVTILEHDGGDDTRLFLRNMSIDVFASDMTKKEYQEMEKDLDKYILKGNGFKVYAWNDSSGYDYWTKNKHDSNYIQITVSIENFDVLDFKEIEKLANQAYEHFCGYDNTDYHDFSTLGE